MKNRDKRRQEKPKPLSNKAKKRQLRERAVKAASRVQSKEAPPGFTPSKPVPVDKSKLNGGNSPAILFFPTHYEDKPFKCVDCGLEEVWRARQQKWWYEVAGGALDSTAVRCSRCRKNARARKRRVEKLRQEGLARKKAEQDLRTKRSG